MTARCCPASCVDIQTAQNEVNSDSCVKMGLEYIFLAAQLGL